MSLSSNWFELLSVEWADDLFEMSIGKYHRKGEFQSFYFFRWLSRPDYRIVSLLYLWEWRWNFWPD